MLLIWGEEMSVYIGVSIGEEKGSYSLATGEF